MSEGLQGQRRYDLLLSIAVILARGYFFLVFLLLSADVFFDWQLKIPNSFDQPFWRQVFWNFVVMIFFILGFPAALALMADDSRKQKKRDIPPD